MLIRVATESDLPQIASLFRDTINTVSAKDYNEEQLKLWSSRDDVFWHRRFREQYIIVAESLDEIIGFSSLTDSGYVDFMYVHKDHQRKGVAKSLLAEIERHGHDLGLSEIHSHVSITAKPFFLSHGFVLIKEKRKMLNDVSFISYAMRKPL